MLGATPRRDEALAPVLHERRHLLVALARRATPSRSRAPRWRARRSRTARARSRGRGAWRRTAPPSGRPRASRRSPPRSEPAASITASTSSICSSSVGAPKKRVGQARPAPVERDHAGELSQPLAELARASARPTGTRPGRSTAGPRRGRSALALDGVGDVEVPALRVARDGGHGRLDVTVRHRVAKRKASDVFVECLEAEGVKHVFGIPGEETLDLNESLSRSSIEFIPVRHEQGGAYMADVWGRLTGRAGVCLGTLGPGALNLVTAVADAYLDRAPLVALTGQGDLERMHKESHQYIDLPRVMRPITKWNARVQDPEIIPEVVRKAFKVAEGEKPGATHIELPEDVMATEMEGAPLPRKRAVLPEPPARELLRAADMIRGAVRPVALAGQRRDPRARRRRRCASSCAPPASRWRRRSWARACCPPTTTKALGSVGLQSGDYEMAGFGEADVVLAIGYDLVEHSPEHWNPNRDKTIICIDSVPAEIDAYFIPEVELVGDIYNVLTRLGEECRHVPHQGGSAQAARRGAGPLRAGEGRRRLPGPAAARALGDPPGARPRRHPDLGRRAPQAVDRADVPRLRAEHRADRQRAGGDGLRRAGGRGGQARAPGPQGRDGQRRRRLPHELPGARDRRAARDRVRERDLGEQPVRLDRLEAGQEVRHATSAPTSRTRTS